MVDPMLSHASVIAAFGGLRPLAAALDIPAARVIHWPRRGIPPKYWSAVEDAGMKNGVLITARHLSVLPAQTEVVPPKRRARRKTISHSDTVAQVG
jgi:hypothetical protein